MNHEEAQVKAVRYRNASGEFRIGRLDGDQVVDAGPAGEQGFIPTRAAWTELAAAGGPRMPLGSVTLVHPVVPRKLICIGLNYRDHAEESELDLPEVPVIFAKWTTSLIGHGETIVIPREETRPDYEGELAFVIG
jgi:2-keto-4-pentenoate hydratase/2-oxohepta-3-ene-1,7-dioic acid hydratase in catechol pathway